MWLKYFFNLEPGSITLSAQFAKKWLHLVFFCSLPVWGIIMCWEGVGLVNKSPGGIFSCWCNVQENHFPEGWCTLGGRGVLCGECVFCVGLTWFTKT